MKDLLKLMSKQISKKAFAEIASKENKMKYTKLVATWKIEFTQLNKKNTVKDVQKLILKHI